MVSCRTVISGTKFCPWNLRILSEVVPRKLGKMLFHSLTGRRPWGWAGDCVSRTIELVIFCFLDFFQTTIHYWRKLYPFTFKHFTILLACCKLWITLSDINIHYLTNFIIFNVWLQAVHYTLNLHQLRSSVTTCEVNLRIPEK